MYYIIKFLPNTSQYAEEVRYNPAEIGQFKVVGQSKFLWKATMTCERYNEAAKVYMFDVISGDDRDRISRNSSARRDKLIIERKRQEKINRDESKRIFRSKFPNRTYRDDENDHRDW